MKKQTDRIKFQFIKMDSILKREGYKKHMQLFEKLEDALEPAEEDQVVQLSERQTPLEERKKGEILLDQATVTPQSEQRDQIADSSPFKSSGVTPHVRDARSIKKNQGDLMDDMILESPEHATTLETKRHKQMSINENPISYSNDKDMRKLSALSQEKVFSAKAVSAEKNMKSSNKQNASQLINSPKKDTGGKLRLKKKSANNGSQSPLNTSQKLVNFQHPMVEVEELEDGENLSASIEQKISRAKAPEFVPRLNQMPAVEQEILNNIKDKLLTEMRDEEEKLEHRKNKNKRQVDNKQVRAELTTSMKRLLDPRRTKGSPNKMSKTISLKMGLELQRMMRSGRTPGAIGLSKFQNQRAELGAGFGLRGPLLDSELQDELVKMENADRIGLIRTSLTKMTSLTKTRGFSKSITKSDMLGLLQQDTGQNMRRGTLSLSPGFSRDVDPLSLTMKTSVGQADPLARQSLRFGTVQDLKNFEPPQEQDLETYKRSYKLAMLAYFSNMPSNNFQVKKQQMIRNYDLIVDKNKQKEEQLEKLYLELGAMTHNNLVNDIAQQQAIETVQKQVEDRDDPNNTYQAKLDDTKMNNTPNSKMFDFTSLSSIYQQRELLKSKLNLVDTRIKESDVENHMLLKMLKQLNMREDEDGKLSVKMVDKENDLQAVVSQLDQINQFESKRKHDFEQVQKELTTNIIDDQDKMENVLQEKMQHLKNQEDDAHKIVYNIMQTTRSIRVLRQSLEEIDVKKALTKSKISKIMEVYKRRQQEIETIYIVNQFNRINEYSDAIMFLEKSEHKDIDEIRIEGLQLIDELKGQIQDTQQVKNFKVSEDYDHGNRGPFLHKGKSQMSRYNDSHTASKVSGCRNAGGLRVVSQTLSSNTAPMFEDEFDGQVRKTEQSHYSMSKQLQNQEPQESDLENYVLHRDKYDTFYRNVFQNVNFTNIADIIQKYMQSSIRLNSLQTSFKNFEIEKRSKNNLIVGLTQTLMFLVNEASILSQAFNKFRVGDDLVNLRKMLYQQFTPSVEIDGVVQDIDDDQAQTLYLRPLSMEGKKIYIHGILGQTDEIKDFKLEKDRIVHEYFTGFKQCIVSTVCALSVSKNCIPDNSVDFEPAYLQKLEKLIKRFGPVIKKQKRDTSKKSSNPLFQSMNRNLRSKIKQKGNWQSNMKSNLQKMGTSNARKVSTGAVNINTIQKSSNSHLGDSIESEHSSRDGSVSRGSDDLRRIETKQYLYQHMNNRELHLHRSFKTLLYIFGEADPSVVISTSKTNNKFTPKRKSISLSTGSAQQKDTSLNIKDFDPVFRVRDFHEVKKRVHLMMIGDQKKYNSTRQKQEFKLKTELRQLEREKLASLVVDQEQIEFLRDGNKIKSVLVSTKHEADRKLMELQSKEETNKKGGRASKINEEDEQKDEEKKLMKVTSSDLELMRQDQAALDYAEKLNSIRKQSDLNFAERLESKQLKSKLYRQKQAIEEVQRSEEMFIGDLRDKINMRYNTLRSSIDEKYGSSNKNSDLGDARVKAVQFETVRPSYTTALGKNKDLYDVPRMMPKQCFGNGTARQSKTDHGQRNRHAAVNTSVDTGLKLSQKKRNDKLFDSLLSNSTAIDYSIDIDHKQVISSQILASYGISQNEIKNRKGFNLKEAMSKINAGVSFGKERQTKDEIVPLKSACFNIEEKRTTYTASIKERIKINNRLTQSVNFQNDSIMSNARMSAQGHGGEQPFNFKSVLSDTNMVKISSNQRNEIQELVAQSPKHMGQQKSSQLNTITAGMPTNSGNHSKRGSMPLNLQWNLQNRGYTQNMAFNLTYGTANTVLQKHHQHQLFNKFINRQRNTRTTLNQSIDNGTLSQTQGFDTSANPGMKAELQNAISSFNQGKNSGKRSKGRHLGILPPTLVYNKNRNKSLQQNYDWNQNQSQRSSSPRNISQGQSRNRDDFSGALGSNQNTTRTAGQIQSSQYVVPQKIQVENTIKHDINV